MRSYVKQISMILVAVLITVLLVPISTSAAETGTCTVANKDWTIVYQNQTLFQAARLTYNTTDYWIDMWSDVTTDGAIFRGTNLSIGVNTYTLTGNITITNGINLYGTGKVYGTVYVTGGVVEVADSLYVHDWELSGGTVNFQPEEKDLAAGYEAVDNGNGTWSIQKISGKEPLDVVVNNMGEGSGAMVYAPAEGWISGENTFTVSCEIPCVVAISTDGGTTYTRLIATATDVENTYSFTTENTTTDFTIAVVLFGDVNGDGNITNADVTRLKAAYQNKVQLDALTLLAADVNNSGDISNADVTKLKAAYQSKATLGW